MPTNNESDEQVRELANHIIDMFSTCGSGTLLAEYDVTQLTHFILAREKHLLDQHQSIINEIWSKHETEKLDWIESKKKLRIELETIHYQCQQALSTHNTTEDGKDET